MVVAQAVAHAQLPLSVSMNSAPVYPTVLARCVDPMGVVVSVVTVSLLLCVLLVSAVVPLRVVLASPVPMVVVAPVL